MDVCIHIYDYIYLYIHVAQKNIYICNVEEAKEVYKNQAYAALCLPHTLLYYENIYYILLIFKVTSLLSFKITETILKYFYILKGLCETIMNL